MRSLLFLLALSLPLHADCVISIFPSQTKSMQFTQTRKSALGETKFTLTWSDRRIKGNHVEWTESFTSEERETRTSPSEYRCSKEGITPIDEGTKFTGVQYGNQLTPGATWSWAWAGTGISASYAYRVIGKEKVTVPAGTYDAVRVDYTAKALSETRGELPEITGSLWIVEGVGLVKQYENDPALGFFPDQTTLELLEIH